MQSEIIEEINLVMYFVFEKQLQADYQQETHQTLPNIIRL